MMRRLLPLLGVLVLLCAASLVDLTEGAGGGGGGGGGGGRGGGGPAGGVGVFDGEVDSSNPRGLSGGTWAACSASSLLAAAALLW
ncbi:Os01g0796001 [Oryza sativa Japonica Group]|uniref:Os01g0796001 protein n=1 Tax=Oryza sativa subsp. japonica TaxID=39947 RepID=C7IXG5_ORYSJ|nr:hypothetical protein DAI22_01g362800 [Oryza sativa Japonica Group]BAH91332.1 Os01g0796001 [Oryza sativa Japonica Group]|eukprot:NP_001172602.1 Os01g0796001 [Oryza sativa Japonica Group]